MSIFKSSKGLSKEFQENMQRRCAILEQLSEEEQDIFKEYDQQKHELSCQKFLYQTGGILTAFYAAIGGSAAGIIYNRYPSDHHDNLLVFFFAAVAMFFGYEAYKTGKETLHFWKKTKEIGQEITKLKEQLNSRVHSDLENLVY